MAQATVSIKLQAESANVVLVVSTNASLTSPIRSSIHATTNLVAKITITGLTANTQYYYGVELSGVLQTGGRGSFKTPPTGAANFSCAFASCAYTGSENTVFDTIQSYNPHFFIHMGDIHYEDIQTNNVQLYRDAYDAVFASQKQSSLFANLPTVYMWDDHDFGGDDSSGNASSKPAAIAAYKERVPHYPLTSPNGPIYQSFVYGRIRFIITDLRSEKTPKTATDDANKTTMGETQIQWFFSELLQPEPIKIWVSTFPWNGAASAGADRWSGYTTERKRIANFIKDNGLEGRVAILSGDMHGLAIDDGTNGDYADGGGAKIPVIQAAPLHQWESVKGGPWTTGPFLNGDLGNQFGLMEVEDDGTTILVKWYAKRGTQTMAQHTFQYPPPEAPPPLADLPTSGITFHIDAINSSVATLNGKVTRIDDLSPLGNHLTQNDTTKQPTKVANAYGTLPAFRFGGAATISGAFAGHNMTNEMTVFVVVALADPNGGSQKILDFNTSVFTRRAIHKSGSQDTIYVENEGSSEGITFSVANEPYKYFIITNVIKAGQSSLYKNGSPSGTAAVTATLSDISRLDLARSVNDLYYLSGDFGEVLVYNRAIEGTELSQVHDFLKNKWSI